MLNSSYLENLGGGREEGGIGGRGMEEQKAVMEERKMGRDGKGREEK